VYGKDEKYLRKAHRVKNKKFQEIEKIKYT
jgi:hypothetical protein